MIKRVKTLPKITFCLTAGEADAVDQARQRLGMQGVLRNRSEVIRAAIICLHHLSDAELNAAAQKTQQLKPGRKGNRHGPVTP